MQNAPPTGSAETAPTAKTAKKKGRGCLVALALVGGAMILLGAACLAVAWHYGVLSKLGRGAKLAYQGTNAPGTTELRALGCDQAAVLNADDLGELVGKTGKHSEKLIVTCLGRAASVPSCDDAAAAYVHAVGTAAGAFVVTVRRTDDKGEHCTKRYEDDGTPAH